MLHATRAPDELLLLDPAHTNIGSTGLDDIWFTLFTSILNTRD